MYTIYKHTFENGKTYIGLTKHTMEERLDGHISASKNGSTYLFHKALRKYNFNVKSEILETCETIEEANALEQKYIKIFDTFGKNGYNMTEGGNTVFSSTKGKTYFEIYQSKYGENTEQYIKVRQEKMSKKLKGRKVSQETREKMSNVHKGKVTVKDIETGKCFKVSIEEFHSNPNYVSPSKGLVNVLDLETGEKLRVSSEEFHSNEKYQSVALGFKHSEESKKKM